MSAIELTISPSELDVMRQCPLRHQLLYAERWVKPPVEEKHPLAFGTLWHSILEQHYRAIQTQQRRAEKELGGWRNFDQSLARYWAERNVLEVIKGVQDPEVQDILAWMYDGHVEAYGADPQWQIMAVEHAGEVALPGPAGFNTPLTFRLKFKMDLVVKEEGRIWIIDNKSCKNLPYKLELDLDDQFGLYHWAAQKMGVKVFGTMHNAARKVQLKGDRSGEDPSPLENRFRRTPLTRGATELERIALEAWQDAHERYQALEQHKELKRLGLNVEAQRHPSPMQCGWKCDWTEACIAGRKGVPLRDYISRKGFRQDRSRH